MADRQQNHQYRHDSDSLAFPNGTVVGIVDDPESAAAALDGLIAAGVPEEEITVLYGDAGADRLDASGQRHGLLGKVRRLVQNYGDQDLPHVRRQAAELRRGNFVISAPAGDDDRDFVADILTTHGGHFVNHYGSWTVTRLKE